MTICICHKQIYEISSEILCGNNGNSNRYGTDSFTYYSGNIDLQRSFDKANSFSSS